MNHASLELSHSSHQKNRFSSHWKSFFVYLELFDEAHIVDFLQIYGCSYVEQLSRSLYVEYKHSGIDVQCQVCIVTLLNRHENVAIRFKQRSDLLYKHPQCSVAGSPENNYIFETTEFGFVTWHMVIGCNP